MASLLEDFQILFDEYSLLFNAIYLNRGYDDLTMINYQYLYTIGYLEKATVTTLSEALHIKKSSITNMIEVLEGKSYVQRTASVHDKRSIIISLTSKGKDVLALEEKVQRAFIDEMETIVDSRELQQFSDVLRKITSCIKEKRTKDGS